MKRSSLHQHINLVHFHQGGGSWHTPVVHKFFYPLSDMMDFRHHPRAMCVIMRGEKTHTRGLQRKKVTPYKSLFQNKKNKHDKIRPHSIRSLQFDQKVRPLSFRPEKFDLLTATHIRCMHARPHRRKDQLPLRSLRDLRSR